MKLSSQTEKKIWLTFIQNLALSCEVKNSRLFGGKNMGNSQDVVARLTMDRIILKVSERALYKDWAEYSKYIQHGGTPQRVDKYCQDKSIFKPLVIVHRRDFIDPFIMKKLIGWNDMALKNSDIVQTTSAVVGVDLLDNNFLLLAKNKYTQITEKGAYELSESEVLQISQEPFSVYQRGNLITRMRQDLNVFDPNYHEKSLQFHHAIVMSIKG